MPAVAFRGPARLFHAEEGHVTNPFAPQKNELRTALVTDRTSILTHPQSNAALQPFEQMPHLVLFGAQVGARVLIGARAARNALDHANARALELLDFVRIV